MSELGDAVAKIDPRRLFVARALDPELRQDLHREIAFEELPFVRGRTVVPDGLRTTDLVVAGHPNHLGVFDHPDAPQWIAVTGAWSALRDVQGAVAGVEEADPVDRDESERFRSLAADLAKRIDQLPGVRVAFPPEAPVVIALLATDPEVAAKAMALPGVASLAAFEELPGGLRIELLPGSATRPAEYAAALQAVTALLDGPEA